MDGSACLHRGHGPEGVTSPGPALTPPWPRGGPQPSAVAETSPAVRPGLAHAVSGRQGPHRRGLLPPGGWLAAGRCPRAGAGRPSSRSWRQQSAGTAAPSLSALHPRPHPRASRSQTRWQGLTLVVPLCLLEPAPHCGCAAGPRPRVVGSHTEPRLWHFFWDGTRSSYLLLRNKQPRSLVLKRTHIHSLTASRVRDPHGAGPFASGCLARLQSRRWLGLVPWVFQGQLRTRHGRAGSEVTLGTRVWSHTAVPGSGH